MYCFICNISAGLPIVGATLHKYIEVNTERDTDSTTLDETAARLEAYKQTVLAGWAAAGTSAPPPRMWGGEVGPHNGGTPPCAHSSMRWATFADSLWYIDALASAGKLSYEAFCRQDLIGADYGLLDCATGEPLPDYWSAVLWSALTGPIVLEAAPHDSTNLRTYAQCTNRGV